MRKFPYHKQEKEYSCGAAAMRMALEFFGMKKSEEEVAKIMGTSWNGGTLNKSFPELAEKLKLNYSVMRNASLDDLKRFLKNGFVVIMGYHYSPRKIGHYSVLKKIGRKNIYFWDPHFGPEHKYSIAHFMNVWKSSPRGDNETHWLFALKK